MSIKRYVTSKDMMTTALDKTVEKEFVADAVALKDLNYRIINLENTRVTGVKGDNESVYRTGNVNLKPSHIGAISTSILGVAGGVAELDDSGKLKSSQLPSSVDDIVEGYYNTTDHKFYKESTYTTEIEGEADKIYLSLDTNLPYRWSGSVFVEIPWGLALGETSSTAYRGDRGKAAYDTSNANKTAISKLDADFATVEIDAGSSAHAYNIGNYFVINHTLCRATSVIAIGDAIAIGTNAVPIVIMEELATNFVKGVKGNSESSYRHGNVNITLANLGYEAVNNLTTETAGKLLDARQGKALNTSILSISGRVEDIENNISDIEDTTTASRNYSKGEYLTLGGIFYKVTTPITVGETLTVGMNISVTKIADELGGGSGGGVCYLGDCSTAASTAAKTVTVSDPDYVLKTGTEIVVLFTNTNTASNPTLSVNGGAAKSIYYGSGVVTTSKLGIAAGTAGEYVRYVYDGTYWVWIGHSKDIDAGHTILNSSGTAMTQREKLQFNDSTVSDDSINGKTVITPKAIKTVLNSSGTTMTQREKIQFSGMNVSDNSSKTVVQGQLVKVTSAQYEALSSSQKNDPNTTYMITDAENVGSIASTITISSSNWSNSTTTVDGVAYYTNQVSLATVFDSHPDIYLGALSTFPTNAEKQAYMAVDYITVDASTNKLKCYARSKPTANFVLIVKGVSV